MAVTCYNPLAFLGLFFLVVVLITSVVLAVDPSFRHALLLFVSWAREHQLEGGLAFAGLYAVGAVMCMPEILLATAAGYIFSFPLAFVSTWIGGWFGCMLAFGLGRFFLREWVSSWIFDRFETLRGMEFLLEESGFTTVLLIRLPYVPFVHMNYLLACTKVAFRNYTTATLLGTIRESPHVPFCVCFRNAL